MNSFRRFIESLAAAALLLVPASAQSGKLQVYILAGQSNMQGHAKIPTFEHIGMDPAAAPLLALMTDADGKPKISTKVWISALGCGKGDEEVKAGPLTAGFGASDDKIGPEFTFGLCTEKLTGAPVLLIKTAWGGKSLHTDFRSPSAGAYVFNDAQLAAFQKQGKDIAAIRAEKEKATGVYYRLMLRHVNAVLSDIGSVVPGYDSAKGYELAGFVWLQGWNDMVDGGTYPDRDKPGGYDAYSTALAHFIRDVWKDLNTPELPFVIGVMGVGGPTSAYGPEEQRYRATHQNFRDAMAAPARLPEFRGNVSAVLTEQYWDPELKAARAKEAAIRAQIKKHSREAGLNAAEEKAALETALAEGLTQRERLVMEEGVSNAEFHYLGSAKILGGIGRGLAEAMAELRRK